MADSQGHHDDIKSFAATRAFEEERKKTNEQVLNLLGIPHADEARRKMTELVHDKVVTALGQQCQWGVKAGTEQSAELPPVADFSTSPLERARIFWLNNTRSSLDAVLLDFNAREDLLRHLGQGVGESGLKQLELLLAVRELSAQPADAQAAQARELADAFMPGFEGASPAELVDQLLQAAGETAEAFAREWIPSFLCSPSSDAVVRRLPVGCERPFGSASHLLWDQYRVEPAASGWLYSIVSAVDESPECVTISDPRVAGHPLIYVNQAFCRTVGYSRSEVLGRNCRFLQGPETEVGAVAAIVGAIRSGADCSVRITNYKRSGETFLNLLCLRAVTDAEGAARFYIGVQCDASQLKHSFASTLVQFLPTSAPLMPPILSTAPPPTDSEAAGCDVADSVRFCREHTIVLKALDAFDPTIAFTCLKWSGGLEAAFDALLLSESFTSSFEQFVTEHRPHRSQDWTTYRALSSLSAMAPKARDEKAKELFTRYTSEQPAGKTALALRQALEKEASQRAQNLRGVFASFLTSPLCTTALQKMGAGMESGGTQASEVQTVGLASWLEMLAEATEALPHAIIVADMHAPGARIVAANEAFAQLTGHAREDVIGRNCRFMQGPQTEQDAVRRVVESVRCARQGQVELTNYKADGTAFRNLLSLQPVHDSNGVYRYSIGVLSDAATLDEGGREEVERLRRLLPTQFEVELEPLPRSATSAGTTETSHLAAGKARALQHFGAFAFLQDIEGTLGMLARDEDQLAIFRDMLPSEASRLSLSFWVEACEIDILFDDESRDECATRILAQYFGSSVVPPRPLVVETLMRESEAMHQKLVSNDVPSILLSSARQPALELLLRVDSDVEAIMSKAREGRGVRFGGWANIPSDVAEWHASMTAGADGCPFGVSISDPKQPGNPLVYINAAFTKMTGYRGDEALGRNCRFLQGPDSETGAVEVIKESVRQASRCCVRITNYRKSGGVFQNLLVIQPVLDSTGELCACVGLQLELDSKLACEAFHNSF